MLLLVADDMTKELETDPLTGLPNRAGFLRQVGEILRKQSDAQYAILFFNIQRFKAINDLFGYEKGDRILKKIVDALEKSFLKPLVTARMEADRFVAFVDTANLKLDQMNQLLHYSYHDGKTDIELHGRCGIYYVPKQCTLSVSDMCDRAKLAKNYISNQYVQPYSIYDESMKMEYDDNSRVMINLEQAIEKNEFCVYYQPVYDAKTEEIVSAEALVRWIPDKKNPVLPGRFIPVLENSGHITKLDTFVNRTVREMIRKRKQEGKKVLPVAVNLSRMDLMDKDIMGRIWENVNDKKIPVSMFHYELTESAYADITESGSKFLTGLQKKGAKILIDDFGSGISSFSTVRDYEFDIIKLDMGFVQKIGTSKKTDNILIALIDLAHSLDMKVIAEGVETKEQTEFLKKNGCDYFQGFYYAKPMSQDEFEAMLDREL
ncbi:bifunctional diguanylate cyclase/phosphodiesterase [Clostridium sp. OF09-36]|nr:bifunctional diguanylate cyclase/phosphodiesterase [Clostridium sp. OF09-36]